MPCRENECRKLYVTRFFFFPTIFVTCAHASMHESQDLSRIQRFDNMNTQAKCNNTFTSVSFALLFKWHKGAMN